MKKKLILIVSFVLFVLTACNGDEPEFSREELKAKFWYNAYGDASKDSLLANVEENQAYYPYSIYWEDVVEYREEVYSETEAEARIYPLFYTDLMVYSEEDFTEASDVILEIARNEIYARHGYIFEDDDLGSYFSGCEWYVPLITKDNFNDTLLNEYERKNLQIILALENE